MKNFRGRSAGLTGVRPDPLATYVPTAGMLRVLTDTPGATNLDHLRCHLRGLVSHDGERLTPNGQAAISRELNRRKGLYQRG